MSSLVNLEYLTLKRVFLSDTLFQDRTCLKRLELIDCDFERFTSDSFRNMPNLEGLIIGSPEKLDLNEDLNLKDLIKLKWLHLVGFSNVNIREQTSPDLSLLIIELKDGGSFNAKCISGIPNLKTFILSSMNDEREYIPRRISLNHNFLSSLESIYIENIDIPAFSISFPKRCPKLTTLSFNSCTSRGKKFDFNVLKMFTQLEKLRLRVNLTNLSFEIPSDFFDNFLNLTNLEICLNTMTKLNPVWFSRMSNLKILNLSGNRITHVEKETFRNLTSLTELWLCYNEIRELDDGVFSSLKNLEYLSLFYNDKLISMKPKVFEGLDKLAEIQMRDLNDELQLDINIFQAFSSLKLVYLDIWFEDRQQELTQKYGSEIKFKFD